MKRRIFTLLLCGILSFFTIYKLDYIVNFITRFFKNIPNVTIPEKNSYSKNQNYEFVQITNDFKPYNYQELLNVFYTILDSGYKTFTFYCPSEYEDCISDVQKISNDEHVDVLTTIGNYVSPYNNFKSLKVQSDSAGEITLDITYLYTEEDILNINQKIDEIYNSIIKNDMSKEDIIYAFHDYIINNTKYDEKYESEIQTGVTTHQASKANGPLFEGYGICSGYTDTMAILLDKLDINNYKVASKSHVWNAVKINDKWLHLDLTWDDPVGEDHNQNNLLHKFYLIDTPTLENFDIKDHTYNKSVYLELK